jgi:hypothetical protein
MLLAGTVKIAVRDGVLKIDGDKRDNCVEISTRRNAIRVSGCDGTRITGDIGNKRISSVNVTLLEGDDELNVHDLDFKGDVVVHMNEGQDRVDVDNVNVDGDVDIGMGKDDDDLSIRNSSAKNVTIDGKEDKDDFNDRGRNDFDKVDCVSFESGCRDRNNNSE